MANEPTYDTVTPEFDLVVPAGLGAGVGAGDGAAEPPLEDEPTYDDVEADIAPDEEGDTSSVGEGEIGSGADDSVFDASQVSDEESVA